MPRITKENVNEIFRYHGPNEGQKERFQNVNAAALNMAKVILEACPQDREASLALTKLQEVRMWANAAIALENVED